MGVQMLLNFDNPSATYQPGEVITGNVSLCTTDQLIVKGLTISFHGEGNVYWTETKSERPNLSQNNFGHHHHHHHTTTTTTHNHHEGIAPATRVNKEYKNQETYLNACIGIPLYGQVFGNAIELPAGFNHQLPFSYQLPTNLPMSCELNCGSVKYFAEASLKMQTSLLILTFDTSKSSKKSFGVRGFLDLAQANGVLLPVELQKDKRFGFLCCASSEGFVMELRLARTGFAAGENIMFHLNYSNSSDVTIEKLKARLFQNIQYITFGKQKNVIKELVEKVHSVVISQNTNGDWQDQLQIPHVTPLTDLGGCRIMQIRYTLVISGHASWNRSSKIEVPITVGTMPSSNYNPY